ncbi:MAG: DUF4157 domain-containing protein [Bacteroidota bacterium]
MKTTAEQTKTSAPTRSNTPFFSGKEGGDFFEKSEQENFFQPSVQTKTEEVVQRQCTECTLSSEHQSSTKPDQHSDVDPIPSEGFESKENNTESSLLQLQNKGPPSENVDIEASLNASKGSGYQMSDDVKTSMESSFDADFSDVKIHTDDKAADMNHELSAQAFTHGTDIYFNEGTYNPNSSDGKHLLAHELTHVVQQNGDKVSRKPDNQVSKVPQPLIQRFYTLAPKKRPSGTKIHEAVLPHFVSGTTNSDLFIEVSIPGANKKDPDTNKTGVADFYKASSEERTIGIKAPNGKPKYLKRNGRFQFGGGTFDHLNDSAPKGYKDTPKVRALDKAASNIELGDLKPGGSAETTLGTTQLNNYKTGIGLTKDAINSYLSSNPAEADPSGGTWSVSTSNISSLSIPSNLVYPTGSGIIRNELAAYEGGFKTTPETGLIGSLYVYKDQVDGIWSYEWFPETIPASSPNKSLDKVVKRLNNEVIPHITSSASVAGTGQPKLLPGIKAQGKTGRKTLGKISKRVQKAPKKFDHKKWSEKEYDPWKKETGKFLKNKKKLDKVPVAMALTELKKRSGNSKLKIPQKTSETAANFKKIKLWHKVGGLFGRLRAAFGKMFVKVHGFYEKVKKKFDGLHKDDKASKSIGGSGILKAVTKAAFQAGKAVFKILANRVVTNLKKGIKDGSAALFKHLFGEDNLQKFQDKKQELEGYIQKVNDFKEDTLQSLLDTFVKPYEDQIEMLKKVKDELKTIGDIIKIVKWGVRVLQCATPPLVGCLKLLLQEAAMWMIEQAIQSCWFQEKVTLPLFNQFKFFLDLPKTISDGILKMVVDNLPIDDAGKEKVRSAVIIPPAKINKNELPCAKDKNPSPEQLALARLAEKYGEKRLKLLIDILNKRGIGDKKPIDMAMIGKMGKALEELQGVENKTLEEILNEELNKENSKLGSLKELVENLKTKADATYDPELKGLKKTDKDLHFWYETYIKGILQKYKGLAAGKSLWIIRQKLFKALKTGEKYKSFMVTWQDGKMIAGYDLIKVVSFDKDNKTARVVALPGMHVFGADGTHHGPLQKNLEFDASIKIYETIEEDVLSDEAKEGRAEKQDGSGAPKEIDEGDNPVKDGGGSEEKEDKKESSDNKVPVLDGENAKEGENSGTYSGDFSSQAHAVSGHVKGSNQKVWVWIYRNGNHVLTLKKVPVIVKHRCYRTVDNQRKLLIIYELQKSISLEPHFDVTLVGSSRNLKDLCPDLSSKQLTKVILGVL